MRKDNPAAIAERFWTALRASSPTGANMRQWLEIDFKERKRITDALRIALK